jgi:2-oxo-3-hexenedioate decarboxylase
MALTQQIIEELAERLESAELQRRDVTKITDDYPEMDWKDAYDIQYAIRARKLARGNKLSGLKMGLTSRAKMKQMGVEVPIFGFLMDYFALPDGAPVKTSELIHPKIEAEIAFITKVPLQGPGCHIGDVLAATDFVLPAVEVIDSRYRDFKFDLKSVVADNASSSRYVVGGRSRDVGEVDLKNLGVVIEKNGQVVATAAGASVLGHPAASVAMLANMLAERGEHIPAGTFIMTGGITEAITVQAGDHIVARYQDLGQVSMTFVE